MPIELLLRRWGRAKRSEGCVALIAGEPGIGKSRIAQTVQERLHDEAQTLRYFCSAHHSDSALYPIIQRVERAAGFELAEPRFRVIAGLDDHRVRLSQHLKPCRQIRCLAHDTTFSGLPGADSRCKARFGIPSMSRSSWAQFKQAPCHV